jgi:hypothetical protein
MVVMVVICSLLQRLEMVDAAEMAHLAEEEVAIIITQMEE